jgi:DMSO/TMAO reductase YedYZ molybdopterin-dependent catalytic subunit
VRSLGAPSPASSIDRSDKAEPQGRSVSFQHAQGTEEGRAMIDKRFVFIGGLHRSGTSLLHEILRSHPAMSGFANTGVPEDEGQHLQTVYPPALHFGGPGRFGFDRASFMDERHPLAHPASAARLLEDWGRHWVTDKNYLLEKSPPNLVRTRFLQKLFPGSSFVMMLRHPIAIAYATRKMSRTNVGELMEHSLRCYERFKADMPMVNRVYVLRYEEFVLEPHRHARALLEWLGLEPFEFENKVRTNVNGKYFALWQADRGSVFRKLLGGSMKVFRRFREYEERANAFGYSLDRPETLLAIEWAGPQGKAFGPAGSATQPAR